MSKPTDTLFPMDSVKMDSPRLAWIKKNEVLTYHAFSGYSEEAVWLAHFDSHDYSYQNAADYFCQETGHHGESRLGTGKTEDEAITELAKKYRVPLWNEENP